MYGEDQCVIRILDKLLRVASLAIGTWNPAHRDSRLGRPRARPELGCLRCGVVLWEQTRTDFISQA